MRSGGSLFIAPFWKNKDENAFQISLFKNLKALVVGALIATLLLASVEALVTVLYPTARI